MAVFRVEKTKNYTVMSNHHLRDKSLSLKAKGLLSLMLSLPEDWDYTTKGLARICRDGVDSIRSAVQELEQRGYVSPPAHPQREGPAGRYGVHHPRAAPRCRRSLRHPARKARTGKSGSGKFRIRNILSRRTRTGNSRQDISDPKQA